MIVACTVAYGAAYASICSLALGWVAREQAATDYAIVQSVWNTAIIAGGSLAGLALANAGSALFLLCAVGVMAAASLLARLPSPSTTGLQAI
jgi:predicted MFS family arabinose efflux permease